MHVYALTIPIMCKQKLIESQSFTFYEIPVEIHNSV